MQCQSGGYLNAATNQGWVVQNLFLSPEIGSPFVSTYFLLPIPGGQNIPQLPLDLIFTEQPLTLFNFGGNNFVNFPVGDAVYGSEGPQPALLRHPAAAALLVPAAL